MSHNRNPHQFPQGHNPHGAYPYGNVQGQFVQNPYLANQAAGLPFNVPNTVAPFNRSYFPPNQGMYPNAGHPSVPPVATASGNPYAPSHHSNSSLNSYRSHSNQVAPMQTGIQLSSGKVVVPNSKPQESTPATTTTNSQSSSAWPDSCERWAKRLSEIGKIEKSLSSSIKSELFNVVSTAAKNGTLWTKDWDSEPAVPSVRQFFAAKGLPIPGFAAPGPTVPYNFAQKTAPNQLMDEKQPSALPKKRTSMWGDAKIVEASTPGPISSSPLSQNPHIVASTSSNKSSLELTSANILSNSNGQFSLPKFSVSIDHPDRMKQRAAIFGNDLEKSHIDQANTSLPNMKDKKKSKKQELEEFKRSKKNLKNPKASASSAVPFDPESVVAIVGTSKNIEKRYFRLIEAPDVSTVRPQSVLEQSLAHVRVRVSMGASYAWACDQLKGIRQDMTLQHIKNNFSALVYAYHARLALFHADPNEFNQSATQLLQLHSSGFDGTLFRLPPPPVMTFSELTAGSLKLEVSGPTMRVHSVSSNTSGSSPNAKGKRRRAGSVSSVGSDRKGGKSVEVDGQMEKITIDPLLLTVFDGPNSVNSDFSYEYRDGKVVSIPLSPLETSRRLAFLNLSNQLNRVVGGSVEEFAAYHVLYTLYTGSPSLISSALAHQSTSTRVHDWVKLAVSAHAAYVRHDYTLFFRLQRSAPNFMRFMMALVAHNARTRLLQALVAAIKPSVPLRLFSEAGAFSSVEEARLFVIQAQGRLVSVSYKPDSVNSSVGKDYLQQIVQDGQEEAIDSKSTIILAREQTREEIEMSRAGLNVLSRLKK